MAADVLAHRDGFARLREQRGGVQAAGRGEDPLSFAHPLGQRVEQFGRNAKVVVDRFDAELAERIELRAPANAAGTADGEVAFEALQIGQISRREARR